MLCILLCKDAWSGLGVDILDSPADEPGGLHPIISVVIRSCEMPPAAPAPVGIRTENRMPVPDELDELLGSTSPPNGDAPMAGRIGAAEVQLCLLELA